MPVSSKHNEYTAAEDRWQRCRDCYEGSDAVKEGGVKYLPELDSHKLTNGGKAYEAYKQRALFFNAVGRTVDGFAGAVFQKAPTVKVDPEEEPTEQQEFDEDGNPIETKQPELDEDGNPIEEESEEPELDADGNPIPKEEGEEEQQFDEQGNPLPKKPKKLKKPVPPEEEEEEEELPTKGKAKLGPDGKPLPQPKLDKDGKPIPKLGPDGEPLVDEDTGEPLYEEETPEVDEEGNIIDRPGPYVTKPDGENPVLKHLQDITLTGQTLDLFAFEAMQEVLTTGRYGILVDMADTEIREKQRPYWAGYEAESIINWTTERIEGEEQLIRVVLCEKGEVVDPNDPFELKEEERYRVLQLSEGIYTQTVWAKGQLDREKQRAEEQKSKAKASGEFIPYGEAEQQKQFSGEPLNKPEPPIQFTGKSGDDWGVIEEITPLRRGTPMDFIPFYFVNATGAQASISKPPLLDLVDLNLSHYRTLADLEHGRHFVALPTPWISGASVNDSNEVQIGPSGVLILEKGGSAGMLEFSGAGLRALETADEQKRKMMAVLGARLLEEQAMAAETASAVGMRHSGEQAVLRTIVQVLEQQLTKALRAHCWWLQPTVAVPNELDYVVVELNKDFFSVKMQPPELAALLSALQSDSISYKTFYHNLNIGGITRPGVTDEEEQEEISNKPDTPASTMPNAEGMLNSMIYNNPEGTPMPMPNPQAGAPGLPQPGRRNPPGVTPPGLAASAAAAKAASKARKGGSPFGRTR